MLASRPPAFLRANPDVSIEVVVDDRPVDIVADGLDAGIRLAESVPRDMIAMPVSSDLRCGVVATQGYFETHGRPETPADIAHRSGVNYRLHDSGGLLP